jgi:hypothetical protein
MIVEAEHFEAVSRQFGATQENIRSGRSFVELAIQGRADLVDLETVEITTGTEYRPWIRIKAKKAGIRILVEQYKSGNEVVIVLHAVIPRDAHTYEAVEKLWKQYRSKV